MPISKVVKGETFYIASTDKEKKLFEYIKNKDLDGTMNIITSVPLTSELLNENFESPVLLAVIARDKAMVELLVNFFFEANILASTHNTPLFVAVQNGDKEIVEIILRVSKLIDKHHSNTNTPLFEAIEKGHLVIIDRLLEKDANINAQDFPIEAVVKLGKPGILDYFIHLIEKENKIIKDSAAKEKFLVHFKGKLYDPNVLEIVSNENMAKFLMNDFIKSGNTKLVKGMLDSKLKIDSFDNFISFLKIALENKQDGVMNVLMKHVIKSGEIKILKEVLHIATNNTKLYSSEKVMEESSFNNFSNFINTQSVKTELLETAASTNNFKAAKVLVKYGAVIEPKHYLEFAKQGNAKACAYLNKLNHFEQVDIAEGGKLYKDYCNSYDPKKPISFTATDTKKWVDDKFGGFTSLYETALSEQEAFGLTGEEMSSYPS
nr:ankyrin repeat domain-containing protein [Rickettsia endosymbiont of Ceutorhynchus assimilis]